MFLDPFYRKSDTLPVQAHFKTNINRVIRKIDLMGYDET